MNRTYSLLVDGRRITMLALPGATLDDVWESARGRFGDDRVRDVKPVEPKTIRQHHR